MTNPESYLEKVIAGQVEPVSHLEKVIAQYGGGLSPEEVKNAVKEYLDANPVETYDDTAIKQSIAANKAKADLIKNDGDGTKYLSDDGTYKEVTIEPYDDTQIKADIKTNANNINAVTNNIKSIDTIIGTAAMGTASTTIKGAIAEINGNQSSTVSFSADYKNIIVNRKNGLNPLSVPLSAIISHSKLVELADIDATDIGNGKTLIYDATTQKHKYVSSSRTDELVKMEASADAHYLADLLDKKTIINDNGTLKVKKLDGQEVTIAEINNLKGLTMNIVDLVKSFSTGGVKMYEHTIPTYADLLALDRSSFVDGVKYFVYVLADENHGGIKTTYICTKTSTDYFGVSGDNRDFTAEPIDLASEVTGKLGASNINVDALWDLLTIDDTYKTLTANNEVFGTHGAKAMYDELTTEIGKKANDADFTTHKDDTNIHITIDERTKWNEVDKKVNKTDITTTIDSESTDTQYPSAKAVYDKLNLKADRGNTPDINPSHFYIKSSPFTPASTKINFGVGNSRYYVINGICYVSLWPINITSAPFSNEIILDKLPKAKAPASCIIFDIINVNMIGCVWIEEGKQNIKCTSKLGEGVTKATGYARFSYPVDKTWTPS